MKDVHLHLLLSALALAMCLVGLWSPTSIVNIVTIYGLAGIFLFLMVWEGVFFTRGEINLGITLLTFGVVFWFLIEAVTLTLTDPPFLNLSSHFIYWGSTYPENEVSLANFMIALFAFFMYLAVAVSPLPARFLNWGAEREPRMSGFALDFALLVLGIGYWVPVFVMYQGDMFKALHVMSQMRSVTEQAELSSPGLLLHLQWPGIFAGAAALVRLISGAKGNRTLQIATAGLLIAGAFLSATRYLIAYVALPSLIYLLLSAAKGNRRAKAIFLGFLAGTFLIASIQGAIRSTGGLAGYVDTDREMSMLDAGLSSGLIGFGHYQPLLMGIDVIQIRGDFFDEYLLPFFFTHFIPREFWPNKPVSQAWTYYDEIITRGQAFNVTPSVIAQFYMTWGWTGAAVGGFVMGWLAKAGNYWWSRLSMERNFAGMAIGGLWFAFVFMSFRYLWPLYFQYPLFGFVVYIMLTRRLAQSPARRALGASKRMAHAP